MVLSNSFTYQCRADHTQQAGVGEETPRWPQGRILQNS